MGDNSLPLEEYRTVVLALTGPPAAGKSTLVGLLRDIGVPCKDTGEAVREEARRRLDTDELSEDQIWDVATEIRDEHGPAGPTAICRDWIEEQRREGNEVLCVSSIRDQAELDWLREEIGPTLCVRIDAETYQRRERYIEGHLGDDEKRSSISRDRLIQLRDEFNRRQGRERPYPQHDVEIMNNNDVSMHEVYDRLENVVEVLSA